VGGPSIQIGAVKLKAIAFRRLLGTLKSKGEQELIHSRLISKIALPKSVFGGKNS